ncbi:MAG: FG-GAP and VCBS repeat-containing protein [Opitutaceae bacterium]|nr:FG-GAP and VCBS repeat-containing protein [Opitutaceae bacterium]
MNVPIPLLGLAVLSIGCAASGAAELPPLRVRPQTIDPAIQIGYGLAIADVDGDGRDDILLADAKQIVWYRNPTWQKFVMAEQLTERDNVCIAARDLDGDGKAEVAVGAGWNPSDTTNSGAVFLLEPASDRTQRWTAKKLPHDPTTHRMHWLRDRDGKFSLAVLPLHGRGNRAGKGAGVRLLGYAWPGREANQPEPIFSETDALHQTHNFDPNPDGSLLVATAEGIRAFERKGGGWESAVLTTLPAGEVRTGRLKGGARFVAAIEPMHGNSLAVYPIDRGTAGDATPRRVLLDESLVQGHALATGDLLGVGGDQIVAGWRGGTPGAKVGIRLFAAADTSGRTWRMHALVDDNRMACEDLRLADLNGDGKLDIIAAGRATRNVIVYWNEGAR